MQTMMDLTTMCQKMAQSEKKDCWDIVHNMFDAWKSFLDANPEYTPEMDCGTHRVLTIISEIGMVSCCVDKTDERNDHEKRTKIYDLMKQIPCA